MPETATSALTAAPPDDPVRAALDDPAVFARLVTHARVLARGSAVDHEDLVQTVFQRALAKRADYDPASGSVTAWLAGFLRHVAQERARKKSPVLAGAGQLAAVARRDEPDAVELDEIRATAHRYLNSLAEPGRTAVECRLMHDWDYPEIAVRVSTSLVNARRLVSRGLNKLKALAATEDRS